MNSNPAPTTNAIHVRRPVTLLIESGGEIVASRNAATFESLDDMANWFAAHKQQDASVTWRFEAAK